MNLRQYNGKVRAAAFVADNDICPVIAGRTIEPNPAKPARGVYLKLSNGKWWRLGVAACAALPDGYPKWDLKGEE